MANRYDHSSEEGASERSHSSSKAPKSIIEGSSAGCDLTCLAPSASRPSLADRKSSLRSASLQAAMHQNSLIWLAGPQTDGFILGCTAPPCRQQCRAKG